MRRGLSTEAVNDAAMRRGTYTEAENDTAVITSWIGDSGATMTRKLIKARRAGDKVLDSWRGRGRVLFSLTATPSKSGRPHFERRQAAWQEAGGREG